MSKDKETGWTAVMQNYPRLNLIKSCRRAGIGAVLTIVATGWHIELLDAIKVVLHFIMATVPTILGFTLAALALFFSTAIHFYGLFDHEKDEPSLFQKVQSTFVVIILVMVLTLAFAFVINLFIEHPIEATPVIAVSVNIVTLLAMLFLLFYTLLSILDVTLNLFNFGQYIQTVYDIRTKEGDNDLYEDGADKE